MSRNVMLVDEAESARSLAETALAPLSERLAHSAGVASATEQLAAVLAADERVLAVAAA